MGTPNTKLEKHLNSMRNLILRPLAVFSLSFYVVSCILFAVGGANMLLPSAVFFGFSLLFLILFIIKRKNVFTSSAFFALHMLFFGIFLGFFTSFLTFETKLSPLLPYDGRAVEISGHIEEVTEAKTYEGTYIIKCHTFDGEKSSIRMKIEAGADLARGDKVSGTVTVAVLCDENGQPNATGKALLPDGIMLAGSSDNLKYTGLYDFSFIERFTDMRSRLTAYFVNILGSDYGGLSSALLSGDRTRLPEPLRRDFKRLGVSHILAISGMHLSVICAMVLFITRRLNAYLRYLIECVTVVFYMFFTGFSSSVMRAGIMVLLVCLLFFMRREADMITGIGVAAFIITLIDPFAGGDVGLQLSASAVMAIALFTGDAKKKPLVPKVKRGAVGRLFHAALTGIEISLAVIIFLLPLEYLYYGYISPLAPFSSLILSFFATVLLWLLPFLLVFSPLPFLHQLIISAISSVCDCIFRISGKLSLIPDVCVTVIFPFSLALCFLTFTAFIIFAVSVKKTRIISGILCICLFLSLIAGGYAYTFNCRKAQIIYPSNHLKNDAVTVLYGKKATVIDISDGRLPNLLDAVSFSREQSYTEIENVVITHLHNYHKPTLSALLDENIVRNLYIPYSADSAPLCDDIFFLCRQHDVTLRLFSPGDTVSLSEDIFFHIYEYGFIKRSVQPMIRFDLTLGDSCFTYLSSSYSELHPGEKICSDIVFLGNHGPLYKKDISTDLTQVSYVTVFENALPFYHGDSTGLPFYFINDGKILPDTRGNDDMKRG